MKVITRAVIDMESGNVVAEDSYEYAGPVALCDFGGSGGGSSNAAEAAQQAAAMQMAMYNTTRADMTPYMTVGQQTTPYYASILGIPGYGSTDPTAALEATPGYKWTLGQGTEAIDRSAAARGMLGSGAVAKALTKYGQGLASQTYDNYMNRLYNLIGTGQNAAAQTGQFGASAASSAGNALVAGGQAQDAYEASQSSSGWNDLIGGLGLIGGLALTPVSGGLSNSLAGKAVNWLSS